MTDRTWVRGHLRHSTHGVKRPFTMTFGKMFLYPTTTGRFSFKTLRLVDVRPDPFLVPGRFSPGILLNHRLLILETFTLRCQSYMKNT